MFCDENGKDLPLVVAVSKTQPIEVIQEAIDIGITHFGENYAQELDQKAEKFPEKNWHFIGTIQSRHLRNIIHHAQYIHSLQRLKIAKLLAKNSYSGKLFIEINISGEQTKSGLGFNSATVKNFLTQIHDLKLNVAGFMGIGDYDWDHEKSLSNFRKLVDMGNNFGFTEFSLGMSADWREAVLAGSTVVRIGTEIFGPRQY